MQEMVWMGWMDVDALMKPVQGLDGGIVSSSIGIRH
jgi:hypothetical protein